MKQETTSLESQIFSWEGWDGDIEMMQFYNCTLKVPLKGKKEWEPGEKIACATMCADKSLMEFYDKEGNILESFRMKLSLESYD